MVTQTPVNEEGEDKPLINIKTYFNNYHEPPEIPNEEYVDDPLINTTDDVYIPYKDEKKLDVEYSDASSSQDSDQELEFIVHSLDNNNDDINDNNNNNDDDNDDYYNNDNNNDTAHDTGDLNNNLSEISNTIDNIFIQHYERNTADILDNYIIDSTNDQILNNLDNCSSSLNHDDHDDNLWSNLNHCYNNDTHSDPYDNNEYMDTVSSTNSGKYLSSICSETSCETEVESSIDSISYCPVVIKESLLTKNDYITLESLPKPLLNKANSSWYLDMEGRKTLMENCKLEFVNNLIRSVPDMSKVQHYCHLSDLKTNIEYTSKPILFPGVGAIEQIENKESSEDDQVIFSVLQKETIIPSSNHMKSLLALSIALALMNIAIGSTRNLQSSINSEGGIGMISLAISCVMFMIGSIFSSIIVQHFQTKKCFLFGLIPQLIYTICNIYPNMWLMIISSAMQGLSLAIVWNAMSTYVTFLARGQSFKSGEKFEVISSKYFGIACFFWQSSMIFGNLIASLVLMFGQSKDTSVGVFSNGTLEENATVYTSNITKENPSYSNSTSCNIHMCGSSHCHYYQLSTTSTVTDDFIIYLLFGVYSTFVVLAIITAYFMEPLNMNVLSQSKLSVNVIGSRLKSVFQFLITPQFLMLTPLFLFSTIELGFATADIVVAFITCPLGVHMVGYSMMCLGVCASLGSYFSGVFNKMVGRTPLLCIVS